MTDPTPWNLPKQERSRKRFEHLLDTTEALITRYGVDSLTTNHIAEAAQLPIGSLYQFFPNKEAVLAALTQRYIDRLPMIFPAPAPQTLPFEMLVEGMIKNIFHFEQQYAAFPHLMSSAKSATIALMQQQLETQVAHILGVYFPEVMVGPQGQISAAVGVALVMGVMPLTAHLPLDVVIQELKTALVGYIRAVIAR
jgi:AcrR family transcriptional regulator